MDTENINTRNGTSSVQDLKRLNPEMPFSQAFFCFVQLWVLNIEFISFGSHIDFIFVLHISVF